MMIVDAQIRPSFIEEACQASGMDRTAIILLDCSDDVRRAPLIQRGRPALATERMPNSERCLRAEMLARRLPIIDTSNLSIDAVVDQVMRMIRLTG